MDKGEKSHQAGHLVVAFDKSRGDALIVAPCKVKGQGIAIGPVAKFLANTQEADDYQEFGIGLSALSQLGEDQQKIVRDRFIEEQTKRFEASYTNVTDKYVRHLWQELQSFEGLVERHGGSIHVPDENRDVKEQILNIKVHGIDDEDVSETVNKAKDALFSDVARVEFMGDKSTIFKKVSNHIAYGRQADLAAEKAYDEVVSMFFEMQDEYFKKTGHDYEELGKSIVNDLQGRSSAKMKDIPDGAVIVMDHIPLAIDISDLRDPQTHKGRVEAILLTGNSFTSHSLFVAQSYGITIGLIDDDFVARVRDGDECIISGLDNLVLVQPNQKALDSFGDLLKYQKDVQRHLDKESKKHKSVKTLDGTKVNIHCNYSEASEDRLRAANPTSFGLVRSETLFDGDHSVVDLADVTEDQWYEAFQKIMKGNAPKNTSYMKTTFRLIDSGGDKIEKIGNVLRNPEEREVYEVPIRVKQMAALLRIHDDLGETGDLVDIMSPMISSSKHLKEHQNIIDEIAQEKGVESVHLGSMVEIPSYAFGLNNPAAKFLSVGSNDLISFLRQENRYTVEGDLLDHSFLNALKTTIDAGEKHNIPVSICGDMASDQKYAAVLMGLGFKNLSCQIQSAPLMKEVISRIDVNEAVILVDALLKNDDPQERREMLYKFNEERLGMALNKSIQMDWTPPEDNLDIAPQNG